MRGKKGEGGGGPTLAEEKCYGYSTYSKFFLLRI